MSLTKVSYSMIQGATANVLDYGADPTGVADSTAAFTAALATGKKVWIPNGTYSAADIVLPSYRSIEGEDRHYVNLNVRTSGAAFFTYTGCNEVTMSNFTARADSGVTNARFIRQTDLTAYTAYCTFTNIETGRELLYSYDGFFIFTTWQFCRDGYRGNPPATHVFIKSIPGTTSQVASTNICQVLQCQVFGAEGALGAIYLEFGYDWVIRDTDFEANNTNAIRALGIRGLSFDGCWFERNVVGTIIYCANSRAPNAQGTFLSVANSLYQADSSNTIFAEFSGASFGGITNLTAASIPSSCVLTNASSLTEKYNINAFSGAGATTFATMPAYRNEIQFDAIGVNTITTGAINGTTPVSTGINVDAGSGGRTYLITYSYQGGTGNTTASSLYMIRCGFDGGNFTATKISGDQGGTAALDVATFSLVGVILYIAAGAGGNGRFGVLGN